MGIKGAVVNAVGHEIGKGVTSEEVQRAAAYLRSTANGNIFKQQVHKRYTECLFHPDLRFTGAGVKGSISASIDSVLADLPWCSFWIARQQSFEVIK